MRRFCEGLPEDRLLGGNQGDVNDLLERDSNRRTYTISSTGATLTYRSALSVLTRYASSLVSTSRLVDLGGSNWLCSNMKTRHILKPITWYCRHKTCTSVK